ncbi:MAG: YkuS family protein [Clostridiaceae bacterium]
MKKIGVEKGLSTIAEYLSSEGYSVEILGEDLKSNVSKCDSLDVIVTADYNTDMMGFSDTSTKVPVINASGLTPEEVKNMIQQRTTK